MNDLERRQRRLDRARFWIRAQLLFVAVVIPLVAGFMFVAAPGCMCGMFEPPLIERALPWVGVVMYVLGLAWMFRLSRPRVEAGERDWRYRDV